MTHKVPLVVCITRLVPQKGLHLISHAIKHVEELVSVSCSTSHVVLSKCDCLAISFKPSSQFDFNWFPSFSMDFILGCSNGHTWENFRWSGWKRIWRACKIGIGFEIFALHIVLEFIICIDMTRHTMKHDMCVCVCVCVCIVTHGVSFLFMLHHLIALYWEWGFLINSLLNYIASLPFVLAKYQDDSRWITVIYKMLKFQGCFWVY